MRGRIPYAHTGKTPSQNTIVVEMGAKAFREGRPVSACPFSEWNSDRPLWIDGWYGAERAARKEAKQ